LFLHKFTAFSLLFFVIGMVLRLGGGEGRRTPRRHAGTVLALIGVQITLGLMVIGTGKSFWVTNVHVLNGLLILAVSFVFAVRALRSRRVSLAKAGGNG
ncbi:MAG TPA: hypothetical protein PLA50_15095, partial [Bacteroidia bacterium]|nr:hypothetical protein [Bacteroidia bacterium]